MNHSKSRLRQYGAIFAALFLWSRLGICGLDSDPVLGWWMTKDEDTGDPTAIVELYLVGEELRGRIVRLFPEHTGIENPKCRRCKGELRNKEILGMTFITGLRRKGNKWSGGKVIDLRQVPWQGLRVSCEIRREGDTVILKAFFLFPVFKAEDTWEKVSEPRS